MNYKLVIAICLFAMGQARPGVYRQDVKGDDCVWPWCKFCPNEFLGTLCKLCPVNASSPAPQEVTTPSSNQETTQALLEASTNAEQSEELKIRNPRSAKDFNWPWCKFCDQGFDLGFLCKLCNCPSPQPQPVSTLVPEVSTGQPIDSETDTPLVDKKLLSSQALAAKKELVYSLQNCDWPWCKFCPDDRLGFLCKLCPLKTTPSSADATTKSPLAPSDRPSDEPDTIAPRSLAIEDDHDFPWCKLCQEGYDLGFLCKLCNSTSEPTPKIRNNLRKNLAISQTRMMYQST